MMFPVMVDKHHLLFPVNLGLIARVRLETHLGGPRFLSDYPSCILPENGIAAVVALVLDEAVYGPVGTEELKLSLDD